jgi:hypothetical protein
MLVVQRFWGDRRKFWGDRRNKVATVGAVAAVVVIVCAGVLVAVASPGSSPSPTPSAELSADASPTPTASASYSPSASPTVTASATATGSSIPFGWVASDLDGVYAAPDLAHRLPMAIMVDDNKIARPQSGFSSASIVIQAMADGGEDRYMMIFQEGTATDIGPVRSARPYFIYWATEYKPLFGHFGGDAESLQMSRYLYNEDDLSGGQCPYHRVSTRPAPHNAYTNSAALIRCLLKRGYPATYQNLPTRTFVDPEPESARPAAQTITIPYRTGVVSYQYDPTVDNYLRLVSGTRQVDPASGQQVRPTTVVVMYQSYAMVPGLDHMRPYVGNIGSGAAVVFQEGKAITATWKKGSKTALTRFYDKSGNEIPLVRGQIFIQSVPIGTKVTYEPTA